MKGMRLGMTAVVALTAVAGCLNVKTESEIKPIHITMDVNLKVDKELDRVFSDEGEKRPSGSFKEVRELLARGAAGFTSSALLEAREGATDDDRILILEENARIMRRIQEIAKTSGVSVESVRRRRVAQLRRRISAGVWYQDDAGVWVRKEAEKES